MAGVTLRGLRKVFADGTVAVDNLDLTVADGEFVVLLGPTGCGKSTILRMVAGLEEPTAGEIRFGDRLVNHVPERRRRVAMVFQDYALYPHLTVADNIAFPLRVAHTDEPEITARVHEVARMLGLTPLLQRLESQLSGGQRQRVAFARAIVRTPEVILLDEPLSNLDAVMREEMRAEIVRLTRTLDVATLYVTHDQTEALTMADRVAVLRRGHLEQVGTREEVYRDPRRLFVAAFLGSPRMSLLQAVILAHPHRGIDIDLGDQVVTLPWSDPRAHALRPHHTARVTFGVRAEGLRPTTADHPGPTLHGTVRLVEHLGHEALVHLHTGSVRTATLTSQLELPDSPGELTRAFAEGNPPPTPLRHRLARYLQHRRPDPAPPATARTEYGFYPTWPGPDATATPLTGDVIVRVPAPPPRRGDRLHLAVDLDQVYLFDADGDRIRLDPPGTRHDTGDPA